MTRKEEIKNDYRAGDKKGLDGIMEKLLESIKQIMTRKQSFKNDYRA